MIDEAQNRFYMKDFIWILLDGDEEIEKGEQDMIGGKRKGRPDQKKGSGQSQEAKRETTWQAGPFKGPVS